MTNYKGPPPINQELVNGPVAAWSGEKAYENIFVNSVPHAATPPDNFKVGFVGWPQDVSCGKPQFDEPSFPDVTPSFQMPTGDEERKKIPLGTGVFDYFTAALIEVAKCSHQGNVQHYGSADDLRWVQGKSSKHFDCLLKHAADRGTFDTDGMRHTAKLAWRALAMLQMEMQEAGAPLPRSAR